MDGGCRGPHVRQSHQLVDLGLIRSNQPFSMLRTGAKLWLPAEYQSRKPSPDAALQLFLDCVVIAGVEVESDPFKAGASHFGAPEKSTFLKTRAGPPVPGSKPAGPLGRALYRSGIRAGFLRGSIPARDAAEEMIFLAWRPNPSLRCGGRRVRFWAMNPASCDRRINSSSLGGFVGRLR